MHFNGHKQTLATTKYGNIWRIYKHIWTPHVMANKMVPYVFPLRDYLAEI